MLVMIQNLDKLPPYWCKTIFQTDSKQSFLRREARRRILVSIMIQVRHGQFVFYRIDFLTRLLTGTTDVRQNVTNEVATQCIG